MQERFLDCRFPISILKKPEPVLLYWLIKQQNILRLAGIDKALEETNTDVRIFGKPTYKTLPPDGRRIGL